MKKIIYAIALVAAIFVTSSCKKDKGPDVTTMIVGEWHLVEMTGYASNNLPAIYMDFKADKSFNLYQKIGEAKRYSLYTGTYAVTGNKVTGEYSDGIKWGGDKRNGITYSASFQNGNLCLTAENESAEVCRYEKASLPQSEKDAADLKTKSTEISEMRFL